MRSNLWAYRFWRGAPRRQKHVRIILFRISTRFGTWGDIEDISSKTINNSIVQNSNASIQEAVFQVYTQYEHFFGGLSLDYLRRNPFSNTSVRFPSDARAPYLTMLNRSAESSLASVRERL